MSPAEELRRPPEQLRSPAEELRSTAEGLRRLERATADLQAPFAVVDLDAFWANAAAMESRAAPKPIRLASKSVRCRALQERVLARPGYHGTLAFTLPEALWLAGQGFEDILVAYPTADRVALAALRRLSAERPRARVTLMVDSPEHLDLIDSAVEVLTDGGVEGVLTDRGVEGVLTDGGAEGARSNKAPIRVCLELDAGFPLPGGRGRIGAKRSPVHTPAQAGALARAIVARAGVELVGMMAYESQIAGLGDAPPGRPLRGAAIRLLQAVSARELARRRAAAVAAVKAVAPLEYVNGGGTGSLEGTSAEPAVTELAAGSGLYGPALFDTYRAFRPRPAALFALPVVRRPGPGVATVLGGGYLASGPAERSRLPTPHLPTGLRLDRQEGAGEVQTPVIGSAADALGVGDRVYFRHTKAGELCEHFNTLHLIEGDRVVEEVPTYRGEGRCFL